MYQNARTHVRISKLYSDVFKIQVGVHQGSVRSPSTIHHHLQSIFSKIPNWLPLQTFVCSWSSNNCWHYGWTTLETGFMEKTSGSQRSLTQHGKEQNYDLQQKPALTQRFRKIILWCVKGLVVIQSSVVNVNLGCTRNVVVLKVYWKVIPIIDANDVWGIVDCWMVDLKTMQLWRAYNLL